MAQNWLDHPIVYPDSFDVRRPVLEAASSLSGRWRVSANGKALEVDLPLGNYSPHERAVIEFALNPFITAVNIFSGLDASTRHAVATAIHTLFKSGGREDHN